ncbi:hypothetical protein B0H13DRAFT_2463133 [Mycena leptocephala]|nr:hypothetical protein B0H13DRAFT_2463133 [Mycena leptocephala]
MAQVESTRAWADGGTGVDGGGGAGADGGGRGAGVGIRRVRAVALLTRRAASQLLPPLPASAAEHVLLPHHRVHTLLLRSPFSPCSAPRSPPAPPHSSRYRPNIQRARTMRRHLSAGDASTPSRRSGGDTWADVEWLWMRMRRRVVGRLFFLASSSCPSPRPPPPAPSVPLPPRRCTPAASSSVYSSALYPSGPGGSPHASDSAHIHMRSRLRMQRVRRLQAMRMRRLRQDTSDGQAADARSVNTDALAGWRAVSLLPIPLGRAGARGSRAAMGRADSFIEYGGRRRTGASRECQQHRAPAPPPPSCGASGWTCATRMSRATRVRRRLLGGRGGKGRSVGSSGDLQQRTWGNKKNGFKKLGEGNTIDERMEEMGRNEGIQMKRPVPAARVILSVVVGVRIWHSRRRRKAGQRRERWGRGLGEGKVPLRGRAHRGTPTAVCAGRTAGRPYIVVLIVVGVVAALVESEQLRRARRGCAVVHPKRTPLEDEVDVDAAVEDATDGGRSSGRVWSGRAGRGTEGTRMRRIHMKKRDLGMATLPIHDFLRLPSTLSRLNVIMPGTAEAQNLVNEISGLHNGLISRHYLGLDNKPRALKDMLSTQDDPSVGSLANLRVVWRNRDITNGPAQQRILSDTKCRPEDDLIIGEDHGYMTVELGESVIFLSNGRVSPSLIFQTDEVSVSDKIVIELAVLRGIASGSEGAIGFYNVTVAHDGDVAAAMTLTWGICRSFLPIDLTRSIEEIYRQVGFLEWRHAAPEKEQVTGSSLMEGNTIFPSSRELLRRWSHIDNSYINWALSFNVNRIVDPTARQIIPSSIQSTARFTRTSMKAKQPVTGGLVREDPSLWPEYGGGNFVDLTLKVKVIQATGTILAHRPNTIHETTRLCGARSCGFTIPFTERLHEGFKMSHSEMDIVSGEGEPEYGRDS